MKKCEITEVSVANLKNVAEVYAINLEVSEHIEVFETPKYSNMPTPDYAVSEHLEEYEVDEESILKYDLSLA